MSRALLNKPNPDEFNCHTSEKDKQSILEDKCLLYDIKSIGLYYDSSSGIAKSGNILASLYRVLSTQSEFGLNMAEVDKLLAPASAELCRTSCMSLHELFTYRTKKLYSMLCQLEKRKADAATQKLEFELWSWMATNARALAWTEEQGKSDNNNLNVDADHIPYSVNPTLRCVLNNSILFDTTTFIYTLDFFGVSPTSQRLSVSKKKRHCPGRQACIESLMFLFNKALPNRCVVRDFVTVFKSSCDESYFVKEVFRRMIIIGLIGGYLHCHSRLGIEEVKFVLRKMQTPDWLAWFVQAGNLMTSQQHLLIWIVREYLHSAICDIPNIAEAIRGTHVFSLFEKSVDVMDACRRQFVVNVSTDCSFFSNIALNEHPELQEMRIPIHHVQTDPSLIDCWKLCALVNEFEMIKFEQHLTPQQIHSVLMYITEKPGVLPHGMARPNLVCIEVEELCNIAEKCVQGADNDVCITRLIAAKSEFAKVAVLRKSNMKAQLKVYTQSNSTEKALFQLAVLAYCKQTQLSQEISAYRVVSCPGSRAKNTHVCVWCNRWQCIYSNMAYKKASPLLGRFVVNSENMLYCAGTDAGKEDKIDKIDCDNIANEIEEKSKQAKQNSRFRICKYMTVSRINLTDIALVYKRWIITTCFQCKRPYVRDFCTPASIERMCTYCKNANAMKEKKKCEICMKFYKAKSQDAKHNNNYVLYDNYHTKHSFRRVNTCTHCSARLVNQRKYQHLTLTNSVAAAARDHHLLQRM